MAKSPKHKTVKCCVAEAPKVRATVATNFTSATDALGVINKLDTLYKKGNRKGLVSELFVSTTWGKESTENVEIACYYVNDAQGLKELDWVQDQVGQLVGAK